MFLKDFWGEYSMPRIKWKDSLFCHEGLTAALWTNWWRLVTTLAPLRSKDRTLSPFCHQIWPEIWERTCEFRAGPIFEMGKILTKKLHILCRIMYYWRFKSNFWKMNFFMLKMLENPEFSAGLKFFRGNFFKNFLKTISPKVRYSSSK